MSSHTCSRPRTGARVGTLDGEKNEADVTFAAVLVSGLSPPPPTFTHHATVEFDVGDSEESTESVDRCEPPRENSGFCF